MADFLPPITLVSCVAARATTPCPGRDLYRSPWFRLARAYVKWGKCGWFILSARHGLLDPERRVAPYDLSLHDLSPDDRRGWASEVADRLRRVAPPPRKIEILAGLRYREFLLELLMALGYEVAVPMAGLGIGQQLKWLKGATQPA